MEHLSKISSEIASTFPHESLKKMSELTKQLKNTSPQDEDQIYIMSNPNSILPKQIVNTPEAINFNDGIDLTKTTIDFIPDVYTFYGYSLPKNTLYLIIILIIVGIIIWYMTSSSKKKKDKKIIEEKSKDDNKEKENE